MKNIYKKELKNPETRYFIFDTGRKLHRDKDFEFYTWNRKFFNLVREGDLFIYRLPKGVSPSNRFYFFGTCKIKKIVVAKKSDKQWVRAGDQYALFEKCLLFDNHISQDQIQPNDLKNTKNKNWSGIFSQYGMNQISKEKFEFFLNLGTGKRVKTTRVQNQAKIDAHQQVLNGNYSVDDKETKSKTRSKQKYFSDMIKTNYGNSCAITGISTRSLLIGAHIVPWSKDKSKRLDPRNGICLSRLVDKCYEDGLIAIDEKFRVLLSKEIINDKNLYRELKRYKGKKISLPKDKTLYPTKGNIRYRLRKFKG
jgi:putative restriction endonuclease